MSKIIALMPKQCLGLGGVSRIYEGLSLLPEVSLQTFETFKPSSDTKLVIGFGLTPPRKGGFNYKTSFVFCSPLLQCQFGGELGLLDAKIKEINAGILDYLFLLHKPDVEALSSVWGNKIKWMPPLFNKKLPESTNFDQRKGICCGGMNRGNKNYYNQALAVSISKYKDQGLYTFGDKPDVVRLSNSIFKQNWIWSAWKSNEEYFKLLSKMKLGLQVSLSESFCYFVLEAALLKIPSIISKAISWYAIDPRLKICVVDNSDDPCEIAYKINTVLEDSLLYKNLCDFSYLVAQEILKSNLEKAQGILGDLIK